MANQTIYIADGDEHPVRLTAVDWALLDLPRLRPLARVAFAVLRTGQQTTVPRAQLLSTAQQLLFEIELDLDQLSCDYWFEYEADNQRHRAGSGMTVAVEGQPRFLRAGFGVCESVSRVCDANSQWVDQHADDLRASAELLTDDRGRLLIQSRAHQIVLVDVLESLIRFLEAHEDCRTITLRGSNAPPNLLLLIRTYEAGGQSAAWAQEALWDLGAGLRDRLIKLLHQPDATEHHPAVARALMTLVGDEPAHEAIRARADAEDNGQRKLIYLELLDGTYFNERAQAETSIDDEIDPELIELDDDEDGPMDDASIDAAMRDRPRTPQALNKRDSLNKRDRSNYSGPGSSQNASASRSPASNNAQSSRSNAGASASRGPSSDDARSQSTSRDGSSNANGSPDDSQPARRELPTADPTPQPRAKRPGLSGDGEHIPQPNLRPMPDPKVREDKKKRK